MKKIILMMMVVGLMMGGNLVYATNVDGNVPNPKVNGNVPAPASTQPSSQSITKLQNPLSVDSIQDVILLASDLLIWIGTAFAVLAIIYVGFKFVMAQGSEDKIKEAKEWFFYIIIGLAILISAKVIVEIVKNTLVNSGVVQPGVFSPK